MVMNIQGRRGFPGGGPHPRDDDKLRGLAIEHADLALVPATPREQYLGLAVVLISLLTLAAVVPFVRVPLPKITAFIPSYESALAFSDLVTAILLFGHVARRRSIAFLALACGYLFNAAIIVLHALSFPGVFSDTGLLGANDQTTAWLYVFWHGGFPLFVLVYALFPNEDRYSNYLRSNSGLAIILSSIGVMLVVTALMLLATVGHGLLPKIIQGGNYSLLVSTGTSPTVLVLSVFALFALWRRRERTVLDVWLMVVMSVWVLDVTLSSVISSTRYDLGWYAGRSYGLVAACCLLILLLLELNRLYDRLSVALEIARTLEKDLTFRAEHDALTGLPNRALFYDRLETAMNRCRRSKNLMALLYLDIDKFKEINDTRGHAVGDDLLRAFGLRLVQCVRASDTVARLGGDEFTLILENISSPQNAQNVIDKLMEALRLPYAIGAGDVQARASIGVTYFNGGALKPDDLVKQADAALYQAKHCGRDNYWTHQPEAALAT